MEMPAMQLLRIPHKKAWHCCHGHANSTRHCTTIWKCQQCSCCAYHKRKPGIAAMVMQTLLGTKFMEMPAMQLLRIPQMKAWHCCHGHANSTRRQVSGNASNAATAHTTKAWQCCHDYANSTRHCISIWK